MTRSPNARIVGFTFLFYIAAGITSMTLFRKAVSGEGIAAMLASIAQHAPLVRITAVLNLLAGFSALVLGVTLYGITRDQDNEVAVLAMACRIVEGVFGANGASSTLGLVLLATNGAGLSVPDAVAANSLGASLLTPHPPVTATFFAVGSTLFSRIGALPAQRCSTSRRPVAQSSGG